MKSLSALRFLITVGILASTHLVINEDAKAQNGCQEAITEVSQDIEGRIGAVITRTERFNTARWRGDDEHMKTFRSPFNNADEIIVFYLASSMGRGSITRRQGQAAENIMHSSKLTREYSQKIIAACEPVASVKFFYWEWYQGWSLNSDNQLVEDKCKNPDGSNYYWGENMCV